MHNSSLLIALVVVSACGDDSAPIPDSGPTDAGQRDGGDIDVTPPSIVSSDPMDGENGVASTTSFEIVFSEPMDRTTGSVVVEPGARMLSAMIASWLDDDTRVIFTGELALDEGAEYLATIHADFRDRAGNALASESTVNFTTRDATRPVVTSSTPVEGATELSTSTDLVTLEFSEPMDPESGVGILSGGRGTLGEPEWNPDFTSISWPLSNLERDSVYALSIENFTDDSGNPLDSGAYILDGFLDFRTGGDEDAPAVMVSSPAEAETGVRPTLSTISITFTEAMNPLVRTALLDDGTTMRALDGSYSDDRRVLSFDVDGLIEVDRSYSLRIAGAGYTDAAGNPLDETAYLGDGAVDFSTGPARLGPVVLVADPGERSLGVSYDISPIVIRFNTAMDATRTSVPLRTDSTTTMLTGSWSAGDTTLTMVLEPGTLSPATAYEIDLRAFTDAGGTVLNDEHPYLRDGILNFTTMAPSGDSCRDPLTIAEATSRGGRFSWVMPAVARRDNGATDSCDSTGARGDFVVRYEKTSGTLGEGGALLRVAALRSSTSNLNIEVRSESCAPARDMRQLVCRSNLETQDFLLDVPAGTYFVWIAGEATSSIGAQVAIEELVEWPEGESCESPYSIATPAGVYRPPAMPDEPHTWVIPASSVTAADQPGGATCHPDSFGSDAVVTFLKTMDTSVLEVTVTATDTSTTSSDLDIEVRTACGTTGRSLACSTGTRSGNFIVAAPAGPAYVWIANNDPGKVPPGATVTIREVPVGPGEACGSARPLSILGDNPVTLDSSERLGAGSCSDGSDITWYRYTPFERIVSFQTDVPGAIVLFDPAGSRELGCTTNSAERPAAAIAVPGQPVCIGISNGSGVASVRTGERRYTGVSGTVTDLRVLRPLSTTGTELSWTGDRWMTVTPTTLYMGDFSNTMAVRKTGDARALLIEGVTSAHTGECAVNVGERLFAIDDSFFLPTIARWFELWDGVRYPWAPRTWDTMPMYVTPDNAFTTTQDACNYDGSALIFGFDRDTFDPSATAFYAQSPVAPSPPVLLGTNNSIYNLSGVAADDVYVYFAADVGDGTTNVQGIYRLSRTQLADPTAMPEPLAIAMTAGSTGTWTPVLIDDNTDPDQLYFRSASGALHVVVEPDSPSPLYLGQLLQLGNTADEVMSYDPLTNSVFMFETQTNSLGRLVRID
jgi:methionine-rich copper-binding protein CopC